VLECHVTGTPLPEISWFQDRKQLDDDVVMGDMASKSSVVIGRLQPEHSGEYVCRATNAAGESMTSASIRVVRKYLFIINLTSWLLRSEVCGQVLQVDDNRKSFPSHMAHRAALNSISMVLSQTPAYTARPRIRG